MNFYESSNFNGGPGFLDKKILKNLSNVVDNDDDDAICQLDDDENNSDEKTSGGLNLNT